MIEINNLQLTFNGKPILQSLSLSIEKNEKAVVAGESGTGKTSLLHAILGFIPYEKGDILINGEKLNAENINKIRSMTAFVPQEIYMPGTSVKELFFTPFQFKVNYDQKPGEKIVEETFSALGLEEGLLRKNTDEISGGQKQRIAIASAILLNKPLVLLDEPTSALDEKSISKVIRCIFKQENKTILATSHNKTWIENSDRIFNLDNHGKNA